MIKKPYDIKVKKHYDIRPGDVVCVTGRVPFTRYFRALNEILTTMEEFTHKFRVENIYIDYKPPFPVSYVKMDKVWDVNSWRYCPTHLQCHVFKGEEIVEVSGVPYED